MDKRGVIVLLMVFLLVISVGCQNIGRNVNQRERDETGQTVYRGTQGLTMNFIKNNPPQILYTTTPLSIILEMKNEGASDIRNGRLFISGIDPRIVKLDDYTKTFNVEGKSKFNLFGGFETVDFKSQAISLPGGTDIYKPTLLASACYEYKTQASPLVCVDPDPYSALEKEACEVRDIGEAGGQGAPLAVTRIEEEAIPGRVNFRIHVANQGQGVVVDKQGYSMNRCPSELQHSDLDTVNYRVTMAGEGGVCKPDNTIKLANGQGTIFCTFDNLPSGAAYQTILNIELTYGYLSQISQPIEIRSIS